MLWLETIAPLESHGQGGRHLVLILDTIDADCVVIVVKATTAVHALQSVYVVRVIVRLHHGVLIHVDSLALDHLKQVVSLCRRENVLEFGRTNNFRCIMSDLLWSLIVSTGRY